MSIQDNPNLERLKAEVLSAARMIIAKKPEISAWDYLGTVFQNEAEIFDVEDVFKKCAPHSLMWAGCGGRFLNRTFDYPENQPYREGIKFINGRPIRDIDLIIIHSELGKPSTYLDFIGKRSRVKIDLLKMPPEVLFNLPYVDRIFFPPDPTRDLQTFNEAVRLKF